MNQFGSYCGPNCKCKKLGSACNARCRCTGNNGKCSCHPQFNHFGARDWSKAETIDAATIKDIKEHLDGVQMSSFGSNIELHNRLKDYYKIPLIVSVPQRVSTPNAATLAMLARPAWKM
jgi:hypothetical protein